jgi:hypothetical protein
MQLNVRNSPKKRPKLSENAIEQKSNASEMCVCLKDTHSDASMFRTVGMAVSEKRGVFGYGENE